MSGTISSTLINSINFVNNNFTLFFIGARHLQEFSKDWSPGGSQQSFILGGSAPKSNPPYPEKVPLCIPSVGNGTPFTCLELCIPLNCCKSTVFKIWINHKTRPFTQLFSQPCNASVRPFYGFFTKRNDSFPCPLIYFNKWNPNPLIYLKPENGTHFGWSLSV